MRHDTAKTTTSAPAETPVIRPFLKINKQPAQGSIYNEETLMWALAELRNCEVETGRFVSVLSSVCFTDVRHKREKHANIPL